MKLLKAVSAFIFISLLFIGCGGGGGSDNNGSSSGSSLYSGHYEGTVRYDIVGFNEAILPLEFDVDSAGNLSSMRVNGVPVDVDDAESRIISSSAIEDDGIIRGQGSFNDPTFGIVYMTYNGLVTQDGYFDVLYSLSGGTTGQMEIIANRP